MGQGNTPTLATGQTAPAFRLRTPDGASRESAELLAAGPVLLAFYKVNCPTCQLTLPFLNRLQGAPFQAIAVSQNDAAATAGFESTFGMKIPGLLDPERDGFPASNSFGITHVPSLFLLEPGGRIAWSSIGFVKSELEELAARAGRTMFTAADQVPEAKSG